MALPINMDDLINQRVVESTRIEFKGDWNPNPIIHSICAFANDIDNVGGGYLVIGIEEENGSPVLPPKGMLMYGKEASNRKQEIDRQHHTIPNKRTKDKHYGNVHNRLWNHG